MSEEPAGDRDAQTPQKSRARINLERAVVLLIDNPLGVDILSQIFFGFGVRNLHRCQTALQAKEVAANHPLDLIVTEALLEDQDGYDFVQTIRQEQPYETNRFTPVILLSAHTSASKVSKARDCGANFLVAKPVSPRIMMDRLLWVAREQRQFLQTDSYAGPDRRFHDEGLPAGVDGRRRDDRRSSGILLEESA